MDTQFGQETTQFERDRDPSSILLLDTPDIRVIRAFPATKRFSMLSDMYVERGDKRDWEKLEALHYKTAGGTFAPHYYRCRLNDETIGIVVFTQPRLMQGPRHEAMPMIKPGKDTHLTNKHRGKIVSRKIGLAARIVVDTMYRAVGVSYRMVNLACRLHGLENYEISSSMSKYVPFAQRAGFRFVKPRRSAHYEKGLAFFQKTFRANPVDHEAIMAELAAIPEKVRNVIISDVRAFYYKCSALEKTGGNAKYGTSRVDEMPASQVIRELQQLVFAMPAYGIYVNPDAGRVLPATLPILAFDNQRPDEPLKTVALQGKQ